MKNKGKLLYRRRLKNKRKVKIKRKSSVKGILSSEE